MICSGVYTALITPFDEKGNIDEEGFRFLIRRQKESLVDGLVVLGTTGEAPTLTQQEKERLIHIACEEAHPLPVMVGCGTSSTTQTIENLHKAADLGAQSTIVVSPCYNKPTQEGLFRHYQALAQESPIPILVYNIPNRSCVNIETNTLKRIADLPQIIGVKESSGNFKQISEVLCEIKRDRPDFCVICGDDMLTLAVMSLGGDGVVSGLANLVPTHIKALTMACQKGEFSKAREINQMLFPFYKAASVETNPIPLKTMMRLCGYSAGEPRSPLTPLNPIYLPLLEKTVQKLMTKAPV